MLFINIIGLCLRNENIDSNFDFILAIFLFLCNILFLVEEILSFTVNETKNYFTNILNFLQLVSIVSGYFKLFYIISKYRIFALIFPKVSPVMILEDFRVFSLINRSKSY